MKKAIIKQPFSFVQWHGEEYPHYQEDADEGTYQVCDEVLVLHEAQPNEMGRLFVIFNERTNDSTVVSETYLEFLNE